MTDAELRALVRDAVARHLGGRVSMPAASLASAHAAVAAHVDVCGDHPSHYRYLTLVAPDNSCVIEPSVACEHCGYCMSHGH